MNRGNSRTELLAKLREWARGIFHEDRNPYVQITITEAMATKLAKNLLARADPPTMAEWVYSLVEAELRRMPEQPVPEQETLF